LSAAVCLPKKAVREPELHFALADFLAVVLPADAVAYHVPNGGLRDKATAAKLVRMGIRAGVPGLAIVHRGRALFLEAKAQHGELSRDQRAMIAALGDAGAEVAVVRSVEDAAAALGVWGVPLRARVRAQTPD